MVHYKIYQLEIAFRLLRSFFGYVHMLCCYYCYEHDFICQNCNVGVF